MSRRKQSNPRQFKRLGITGSPEVFEDGQTDVEDRECKGKEILNDAEATINQETQFPLAPENVHVKDEGDCGAGDAAEGQDTPKEASNGHKGKNPSSPTVSEEWDGPRELEMVLIGAEKGVRSRQELSPGTTWGPFTGKIEPPSGGNNVVPLVLTGGPQWLTDVTWVSAEDLKNNCVVYSKGGHVWCSTTRSITEGEELVVCAVDVSSRLSSIQLLSQQGAMASVLPNAIVNKDIFSCKMCGIWFKSERNLQAHLMYYCSGRPREGELASEKQTNTNHQMSRTCTYPQCNMSFLGPQALKMHLSTHSAFKTEETSPGSSLKCTICDYTADTLMVLQPHILTHLSQTGIRCNQCHFTFQTARDLAKHQELHRHVGLDSRSMNENQIESHSATCLADIKSIEGSPVHRNTEQDKEVQGASKTEGGSGLKAGFSYSRVKSEPSSPRLASSPIQNHMTPAFPIPPFLPHMPFSQDFPSVPQASEILAKMSELVHRRLRHGGTSFPPVMYGALVPKGATCFECNITFSNLDNYLVHKKHYCNGRWQHMSKSHEYSILDKSPVSPKTGGGLANMLHAGHTFEVKGPSQFTTSLVEAFGAGGKAPEEFQVNSKRSLTPGDAEESPNGITLDSKSLKMSESEPDQNRTTCEACKITFSRHENYIVHKQYYCASRHEPPAKRAATNKHVQKSFRTRKRRKMASPDQVASQSYPISSSYTSQDTVESLKDMLNQRYKMIHGLVPKHPEASLTVTKSALISKCNPVAQEEDDAPIDLSKKCTKQLGKVSGLMDYHECAMCKISFNKVEDYLSHKQNFCPGAVLENKVPHLMEEVSRNASAPNGFSFSLKHAVQSVSTTPAEKQLSLKDEHDVMNSDSYTSGAKKIRADEQIWPYYEIKPADYATGIFAPQNERRQSPNEGTEGEKEQPMPNGSHVGSENMENPKIKSLESSLRGDDKQGKESSTISISTPNIHMTPSTPDQEIPMKPKESFSTSPASNMEEISSLKRSMNGSVLAAVNGKYCRPCDIQFNNLSNFITHKKFYCSTHAPEHVK